MYFDTHTHLLDEQYNNGRSKIIADFSENSIIGIMECATDLESSKRAVELAQNNSDIYAAIGIHPHDAKTWDEDVENKLAELLSNKRVRAVGEIGLDYHYDFSPRKVQLKAFEMQMDFAGKHNIPVVIHSREAFADTLNVLKNFPNVTGIWHSFTGSIEIMEEALKLNYFIAFGGVITFKNAKKPAAAAANVPLNKFVLETDCPYMTPVPFRGIRNEPKYVKYVAQKIAELKNTELEIIETAAINNTKDALNIEL